MAVLTAPAKIEERWTAARYLEMPDDGHRYEVLNGELLKAPAPNLRHQDTAGKIYELLKAYVRANGLGKVFISPVDVVLGDDLVQPDVVFVSNERQAILTRERITGAPDLVVEVLSLSTSMRDLRVKWDLYARSGVIEYWVVAPEGETVSVMVLDEGNYRIFVEEAQAETPVRSKVLEGFSVRARDLFAE